MMDETVGNSPREPSEEANPEPTVHETQVPARAVSGSQTYENYAELKAKKPVRWWHEAIIDDMLEFPLDDLETRGKRLGYTAAYLSTIINSDMFKAHYKDRRAKYIDRLDNSLAVKTTEVAVKGMDILLEQMERKRSSLSFNQVAEVTHKTLDRLGYGVQPNGPGGVNIVNVNSPMQGGAVTREGLEEARKALRKVEGAKIIEGSVEERPSSSNTDPQPVEVEVDAARTLPGSD